MNNNSNKPSICVITVPFVDPVGVTFLSNFLDILEPLSNELFAITGKFPDMPNKRIHIIRIKSDIKRELKIIRVIRYIFKQLRTTYNLIKISKNVDIVIFYVGTGRDLLPVLTAKLLGKKTIKIVTGLTLRVVKKEDRRLLGIGRSIFHLFGIVESTILHLTDQIVVESEGGIDFMGLNKYRKKIFISSSLYINFDLFKVKKDFKDRRNLIGYIGRLSPEKGVLNFAKAIPLILKEKDDLEFLIGGDGQLFDEIKSELKNNGSYNKVDLTGWIPHDKLSEYLNELKLIVSPSYTEGGVPAAIIEAMVCGTIVLVTSIAGMDIIKEDENGFILEDNSPEYIAKKVLQVLEHPEPEKIINRARDLAEEKYSYEMEVRRYRDMLYRVLYDQE